VAGVWLPQGKLCAGFGARIDASVVEQSHRGTGGPLGDRKKQPQGIGAFLQKRKASWITGCTWAEAADETE